MTANIRMVRDLPDWLPPAARLYLSHTEQGVSLRALARREGCHASTVLRNVRRFESRRDDPLVDEALTRLGRGGLGGGGATHDHKDNVLMTASSTSDERVTDETTIAREARRILRRLNEPGAMLVIAPGMEKAAVLKQGEGGGTIRVAVLDRGVAQAFALKDWIACDRQGKVARYSLTPAGRAALRRLVAGEGQAGGFAEGPAPFGDQHRIWGEKTVDDGDGARPRPVRYNVAESPVAALARRKDRDGNAFLNADLVTAAERLREDFEIAQMGPRVAQNWDRFLTGGHRGGFSGGAGPAEGPRAARTRVAAALRDLGPGLGDMALRCCCYLEGLEAAEKRMGWSARSGKIVLRIALQRLRRHYADLDEKGAALIG